MLMFGKMSVGVRKADAVPKIRISSAMTTNVYGRRKASRTIPIIAFSHVKRCSRRLAADYRAAPARRFRFNPQRAESRFAPVTRAIPGDNPECRVEFAILKMHSLHPHM